MCTYYCGPIAVITIISILVLLVLFCILSCATSLYNSSYLHDGHLATTVLNFKA